MKGDKHQCTLPFGERCLKINPCTACPHDEIVKAASTKALSIKQPWAWLMAMGIKDIENRSWPTKSRGRIYIHASKTPDLSKEVIASILRRIDGKEAAEFMLRTVNAPPFDFGAIIGEVDIVNCIGPEKQDDWRRISPWFEGPYGFVLANAAMYDKPIPYRGQQGLFEVRLS
jgi:hypothetical protein